MSYTTQLAEVNTAITNILSAGQDLRSEEKRVQQARLETLLTERRRLEPYARLEATGAITNVGEPVYRTGVCKKSR